MSSTNTNGYSAERVTTSAAPHVSDDPQFRADASGYRQGYAQSDLSIGTLLSSLLSDTTALFRNEVRLAKAEVGEKVNQARSGAIMAALGVGTLLLGAIYLIQSAIYILVELGVPAWLSALIVGGLIAVIGYVLLKKGISDLKAKNLAPTRTQANLSRDAHMVKETV